MGLDMYLETEVYISDYEPKDEALRAAIKATAVDGLGDFRPKNINYELAYWRKANAIHGWFVREVQRGKDECQKSYVTVDKLQQLKDACEKVLANPELAPELLPASQGFFFGSYEYDEYYLDVLRSTVAKLDRVLSNPEAKKWWITYQASW